MVSFICLYVSFQSSKHGLSTKPCPFLPKNRESDFEEELMRDGFYGGEGAQTCL